MKKVVLIGDSIREIGYGNPVAERLSDEFEVWQPNDNCRYAKYTLHGLWDWQEDLRNVDIIHWNNGLWDVSDLFGDGAFTPLDEYLQIMLRIARLFKQRASTVIFATTTPVRPENTLNENEVIKAYNDALVPRLKEMGVVINDLYTPLAEDLYRFICDDTIHLSEDGIAVATDLVEDVIRREAKKITKENSGELNGQYNTGIGAPV
ncbi:MAG: hypothetical protein IJW53_01280 [Clostridia bacterium]|nr:hypothetical protein [Clostridia bacterium]